MVGVQGVLWLGHACCAMVVVHECLSIILEVQFSDGGAVHYEKVLNLYVKLTY